VVNKELLLQHPSTMDLGRPPRSRYPLVVLIVDSDACSMSVAELASCQHIVSMAAVLLPLNLYAGGAGIDNMTVMSYANDIL